MTVYSTRSGGQTFGRCPVGLSFSFCLAWLDACLLRIATVYPSRHPYPDLCPQFQLLFVYDVPALVCATTVLGTGWRAGPLLSDLWNHWSEVPIPRLYSSRIP